MQPKLILNFQFFCRGLLKVQSIDVYCHTSQFEALLLIHSCTAEDLPRAHESLGADFPPSSSILSILAHLSEENSAYMTCNFMIPLIRLPLHEGENFKAALIPLYLQSLGPVPFQRFSPLSSWWKAWWHTNRHGAGERAESFASRSAGNSE